VFSRVIVLLAVDLSIPFGFLMIVQHCKVALRDGFRERGAQ